MRTVFLHGEVELYSEAKEALVDRFTSWCGPDDDETPALLVGLLLDDKFTRDGLLALWSEQDLERFMVEVVPRRLSLESGWSTVPEVLHRWVNFLVGTELLMPGGDSAETLHEAVDRSTVPYMEAMADPAEWGAAKFWSVTMLEHGVDATDESAARHFGAVVDRGEVEIDEEVAELVEERESLEPDPRPAHWLPPVSDPGAGRPAEAASTEVIARVRTLLDWLGEGRPLDEGGELATSEVAELSRALGTGDDHFPTWLLLEWARVGSLVRSAGGRLVPTRISTPLLEQPGLLWKRLWNDFAELADFFAERFEDVAELAEGSEVFADLMQHGLRLLCCEDVALPVELLAAIGVETLAQDAQREDVSVRERVAVRSMLRRIVEQWESMGVVRTFDAGGEQVDTVEAVVPDGMTADHTMVELLPLGRSAVRDSLLAIGFVVPTAEEVVGYPAEVLVLLLGECPVRTGEQLIGRWIDGRGAERAAAEVASLLRRVDDPTVRLTALSVLEHTGSEGVGAVLGLAEDPVAGPAARVWLRDRDVDAQVTARDGDELAFALDSMSMAAEADVEAFLSEFREKPTTDQIALVERITRVRHPRRDSVLRAIADGHPDGRVASVAQRSLGPDSGTGTG